jgi:ATP-binding protein involved in chromosome partitioning
MIENIFYPVLKNIIDPTCQKDILSAGLIKKLSLEKGIAHYIIEILPQHKNIISSIENQLKANLLLHPEVKKVTGVVTLQSKPKSKNDKIVLPSVKKIIAVASGKGGVGKSTVAVNIAATLSQKGFKVGLIDLDIYGPSLHLLLDIKEKPTLKNNKIVPIQKHGIHCISMGFMVDTDMPVIWRGPMVQSAVKQLFQDVLWPDLDFLIADLPPGTGDVQLTLAQSIPLSGSVVVTTPQDLAFADAVKGMEMFKKMGVPILGVIENMSHLNCPHCNKHITIFGEKNYIESKIGVIGKIPLEASLQDNTPAILKSAAIKDIFTNICNSLL